VLASLEVNFYQDIYSTAIVVVVTMRQSTGDILSHPGAAPACDSSIVFTPLSLSPQSHIMEDVKTSLVGECIVISPEGQPERSSRAFLTSEDEIK
jgi:hypothetical protein